ncbi:MAG: CHASE2 domain-containing protein [Defluviitaleaceae bacterium]|nr:CHASE2 domain-containing protein [Defluviitaleaceae bacterium]MCL2275270.1 CHASE2 domain-containing protein [Defluviitaleaceae bacterium]
MRYKKYLVSAAVSAALLLLFLLNPLWRWELQLQDSLYRRPGFPHPNIFVFGIDEETLIEFGPMQFWPRQKMADAINILNSEEGWEPAVIAVDVLYSGYSNDAASDAALVDAALSGGNVVFGSAFSLDPWGEIRTLERPFDSLAAVSRYGTLNTVIDRDGVVRRTDLGGTFAEVIYEKYWGVPVEIPPRYGNLLRIHFAGEPGDFFGAMGLGLSFKDIFAEDFEPAFFADAIILIGAFAHGLLDAYFTPVDPQVQMHGVEIHANIVQMLLEGNFTRYAPLWVNAAIMLVMFALLSFVFMRLDMRAATAVLIFFSLFYVWFNRFVYDNGLILTLVYPVVSAVILYVFSLVYRYISDKIAHITEMARMHEKHVAEMKELFDSFVHVMTTAIDERTPYNAHHTIRVAECIQQFITYLRGIYPQGSPYHFDANREEQLIMAALLHDVGKITTPLEVMDKETRLSSRLPAILQRFEIKTQYEKVRLLSGEIDADEYDRQIEYLHETRVFIERVNRAGFLTDEDLSLIDALKEICFKNAAGEVTPVFDESDLENLRIRRGTLTADERQTMNNHVRVTERLLSKMHFSQRYENVTAWAKSHHEFMDGTGYPEQRTADQIPLEVRILTIFDIYDSLTAIDRPYKKATPHDKAIEILHSMAEEGKLDGELVRLFAESEMGQA